MDTATIFCRLLEAEGAAVHMNDDVQAEGAVQDRDLELAIARCREAAYAEAEAQMAAEEAALMED
ncbi:MAG: hypothetical protein FWC72_06440, partial [Oscillospiraceae bacterium]|nr:hypothetical protein [Oscillospiraceae bacterium]